jgi:hypothetical protein
MHTKLKSKRKGDHIHATIFIGEDADHLANAGKLIFRVGEWQLFGAALKLGSRELVGENSLTVSFDNEGMK